MTTKRLAGTIVALMLAINFAAGACSDDDGDTAASTTTTPGSTAPAALPATRLVVPLAQAYGAGTPAAAPGTISVQWFQANGMYVALYSGAGIADLGPVCPGNSLGLGGGSFEYVSNAPTAAGGCDGIESTITEVEVCDAAWLFPTQIPVTAEGQLYASISSPGTTAGVLGFIATGPDAPEIDLETSPVAGC